VEKKVVTSKDSLDFDMAAGGGAAVRFKALD
jgi:alpha-glucosidase